MVDNKQQEQQEQQQRVDVPAQRTQRHVKAFGKCTLIVVLCYVNMVNYMDRYGLLAVHARMQQYFGVSENLMLLLPTVFMLCYMLFGLLFGYLGDWCPRYVLLLVAIGVWWTTTLLGTFYIVDYALFFVCRLGVAAGEAGFSTIAPSILADTVSGARRTVALAIFYAAIPLGSGIGYVANAKLLLRTGQWWWGMRGTALLGALSALGMCVVAKPLRAGRNGRPRALERTALCDTFIVLLTNGTFVLTTLALTATTYVMSVWAWWLPLYLHQGLHVIESQQQQLTQMELSVWLALMLVGSGAAGAVFVALLSCFLRPHLHNVDTIIGSICSLLAALMLAAMVLISNENAVATYALVFCSLMVLNANWIVAGDILMYAVAHTNRCMATALQMLAVHGLAGIIGPYIVEMTYEYCKTNYGFATDGYEFYALRLALLTTFPAAVIAGTFYLMASYVVENDRYAAMKMLLSS